jgi:hypothetical protein
LHAMPSDWVHTQYLADFKGRFGMFPDPIVAD